jgi:hypothetical protein
MSTLCAIMGALAIALFIAPVPYLWFDRLAAPAPAAIAE